MARHNLLKAPPIAPTAIARKPTTIKHTAKMRDASAAGSGSGRQALLRTNDLCSGEADTGATTAEGCADADELPAWQPVYQTARPESVQFTPG